MTMLDKHILALEILREYNVNLQVPHEVEFDLVSDEPIDESIIASFAAAHGMKYVVEHIDDIYMATLAKTIIITEASVRALSEAVDALSQAHGWDYDGWGAASYK